MNSILVLTGHVTKQELLYSITYWLIVHCTQEASVNIGSKIVCYKI